MTKSKHDLVPTDYRRYKLVFLDVWSPEIYHIFTQLDLLKIRAILKLYNTHLYQVFNKFLRICDKYCDEKTDFDRNLPRKNLTDEDVRKFRLQDE